jgi:hypothetical protein
METAPLSHESLDENFTNLGNKINQILGLNIDELNITSDGIISPANLGISAGSGLLLSASGVFTHQNRPGTLAGYSTGDLGYSNRRFVQAIDFDSFGHVTGFKSGTLNFSGSGSVSVNQDSFNQVTISSSAYTSGSSPSFGNIAGSKLTIAQPDSTSGIRLNYIPSTYPNNYLADIYHDGANGLILESKLGSATTAGDILLAPSGGRVGIGTTNPGSALHVAGGMGTTPLGTGVHMGVRSVGGQRAILQLNAPAGAYIDFSESATDWKGRILYDNADNYMRFDTNSAEKMRIDSDGNVGIGTTNPQGKLEINHTGSWDDPSIHLRGEHPTIKFNDTHVADDWYIHVNSNNFYILVDRDASGNDSPIDDANNIWETPYPLALEGDTNKAYIFGHEAYHAGNDGSGSGLDADKLDGLHASSFIRSDADDTITKGSRWDLTTNVDDWGFRFVNSKQTNNYIYMNGPNSAVHIRNDSTNTEGYLLDVYAANGNRFRVRGADALTTINGHTVYHAGNLPAYPTVSSASQKIKDVTGSYGSVKVTSTTNGYAGYAIQDDWVLMSNGASFVGIYNDTNNEWGLICRQNAETELFHNGAMKLETTSSGVTVSGDLAVTGNVTHQNGLRVSPIDQWHTEYSSSSKKVYSIEAEGFMGSAGSSAYGPDSGFSSFYVNQVPGNEGTVPGEVKIGMGIDGYTKCRLGATNAGTVFLEGGTNEIMMGDGQWGLSFFTNNGSSSHSTARRRVTKILHTENVCSRAAFHGDWFATYGSSSSANYDMDLKYDHELKLSKLHPTAINDTTSGATSRAFKVQPGILKYTVTILAKANTNFSSGFYIGGRRV